MIRTTIDNGVGVIMLARPERRNALTPEMLTDLSAGAARIGSRSRAILVMGEGPAFCAGFDLDLCRDDHSGEVLRRLLSGLSEVVQTFRSQPCPVVMAIHGAAVAGGCALLGGADVTVAEIETKLGYPVARLGISPAVSTPFLASEIEQGGVRQLQLDPGLIGAPRARQLGLVAEVVSGIEATQARGRALAESLAAKSPEAISATRTWLQNVSPVPPTGVRAGLDTSLRLIGGDELGRMLKLAWAGRSTPP